MRSSHYRRAPARTAWVLSLVLPAAGCGGGPPSTKPPTGDIARRPAKPAAPADTLPAPQLKVDVADEEKATLAAQAKDDLAETKAMIGELDRRRLTADASEKLKTVESLILAAESAGEKGDVAAMANLARKARLLTAELVPQ